MSIKKIRIIKSLIFILILTTSIFALSAFASNTNGTIDLTYKYAWGENIGWLNFGTSEGDVHITDSALTGYVWAENLGWISLNCSNDNSCATVNHSVSNDGNGSLSGYAWSENTGWIDFDPTYGGVTIDSGGDFSGYAWGENIGWIVFGGDYIVKTDWRPRSARPQCNNSSDDDNDGLIDYPDDPGCDSLTDDNETSPSSGGLPLGAYSNPPASPSATPEAPAGFSILINNGDENTDKLIVVLKLNGGPDTQKMAISNFADFSIAQGGTGQVPYQSFYEWDLCQGRDSCPEGNYTVYIKFYTQYGVSSAVVSDSIIYKKKLTFPEVIKKITEFFKPKPPEIKPPEVPLEELISKEAPLTMQGQWDLLPVKAIGRFVLAPLPKEVKELTEKFPELEKTFEEVGISKITDLAKLKTIKLILPGLTETVALPTAKLESGKFALPQGVPVAKLPPQIKQQLPTEIVFAKTGGELIDFNILLSVTEKGQSQQKIATISGKPLQLVVKPDKPVKSIKGYLVFKSKASPRASLELPLNALLSSLIFANPVFAKLQEKPVRIEEKLVLLEFEYTDSDGDGIYTAEIQAPLIGGEYEIITVMEFEDEKLGKKEIRLITVIDPEGYVYEKDGDKETRIPGAIISIFWLNPETRQYELWPAKEYQQENPQITDATGKYSFLVPEGSYYLKVETPGYLDYDGKPFQVKEGSGIHVNIELKTKYWWLKVVDWKSILLIMVILLLLYNFYRDKIREKLLKRQLK